MRREELDEILRVGEGQTVEFKTSLSEKDDAIQTMVAFANSQGGKVFFGVKDDGTVVGVDMGKNTSENLSAAIRDHTYPSLPVDSMEEIDYDGKKVVLVECPSDVPPVVGVYLYSSSPIPPDKPVDGQNLQAYRRVGKSSLKEDFMRMRQPLRSDPKILIARGGGTEWTRGAKFPSLFGVVVWAEEGSATAHRLRFRLEPQICQCSATKSDLPVVYRVGQGHAFRHMEEVTFSCGQVSSAPQSVTVIAAYEDDSGIMWESRRRLERTSGGELVDAGDFRRRIVVFPPKVERTGPLS